MSYMINIKKQNKYKYKPTITHFTDQNDLYNWQMVTVNDYFKKHLRMFILIQEFV